MISFCKIGCKITLFFAYSQIKCTKSAKMCTLRLFCAILTLSSDSQLLFWLWQVLFIFWRCLSECALKAFTEIFGVWEATLIGYLRHVLAGCFQHLHSFTDACLSQEFHRRRTHQLFHLTMQTGTAHAYCLCNIVDGDVRITQIFHLFERIFYLRKVDILWFCVIEKIFR